MTLPGGIGTGRASRMRMTMRAHYSTPTVIGSDAWGGDLPDRGGDAAIEVACYAWHPTDVRQVLDGDKDGVFGAVRLIVHPDSDMDESCIVQDITDRLGRVLFAGPMRVTAVTRRSGYLAVMLRTARARRAGV